MPGPLEGLRVVELAAIGPVPHAAMVLADLGADVVRVDRPHAAASPHVSGSGDQLMRGRRTVALDLKDPAGLEAALRLVDAADVLVEGFRPGVAERLGIGPDDCAARNPRLVYARVTGWGQTGPRAHAVGHDLNYLGLTGTLSTIGRAGERPVPPGSYLADFGGGSMLALVGVLSALHERERSGRGQVVDVAMVDGVALLSQVVWSFRAQGVWNDARGTNLLDGGAPFYDTYTCRDGRHVAVAALEPAFFATLLERLGIDASTLPDQFDESGWPQLRDRLEHAFAERDRDEWARLFDGVDACVTPVVELAEAEHEPHLAARGTLTRVGDVLQAAPAPRFSRTPAAAPRPPAAEPTPVEQVLAGWAAVPPLRKPDETG